MVRSPRPTSAPACPGNPDALGTSRIATIGDDAPELGLKTYPHTLMLADHEVVLTFDDGPSRTTTPRVLAALAHECVHATFFLIGRNAAAAPALVKQEIAAGDTVGHHSFSHPASTERGLADDRARADIDRGFAADDKAAYGAAAAEPRVPFFRFPGFADTPALDAWLASRHIAVFGADLWASDWVKMTPDEELTLLMQRLASSGQRDHPAARRQGADGRHAASLLAGAEGERVQSGSPGAGARRDGRCRRAGGVVVRDGEGARSDDAEASPARRSVRGKVEGVDSHSDPERKVPAVALTRDPIDGGCVGQAGSVMVFSKPGFTTDAEAR